MSMLNPAIERIVHEKCEKARDLSKPRDEGQWCVVRHDNQIQVATGETLRSRGISFEAVIASYRCGSLMYFNGGWVLEPWARLPEAPVRP